MRHETPPYLSGRLDLQTVGEIRAKLLWWISGNSIIFRSDAACRAECRICPPNSSRGRPRIAEHFLFADLRTGISADVWSLMTRGSPSSFIPPDRLPRRLPGFLDANYLYSSADLANTVGTVPFAWPPVIST
jgi:hypothetical protein